MLVFVYGTLKRGHWNNGRLHGADFVGETMVPAHKLLYAGFPVMTPTYDEKDAVQGEIWDIHDDQQILAGLDRLEGEGIMYDRTCLHDANGMEVFAYIGVPRYWNHFKGMNLCETRHNGETTIHHWQPRR